MQNSSNSVAVTGSRGLLGGILVKKIKNDSSSLSEYRGDITCYRDVLAWLQESRPDCIIHFAAVVPVNIVQAEPLKALEVNAVGTHYLLKAVAEAGLDPWVFLAGTSHVYASHGGDIKEGDRCDPVTVYGKSKLLAENIANYNIDVLNRRICIGRIFSFYHDAQKEPFLYPVMRRRLLDHDYNQPFELRGAKDVRDISPAEDIVDTIIALMGRQYSGTVNIGSGKGVTIESFVQSLAEKPLQIHYNENETPTRLVANIDLLKSILNG